MKFVGELLGQHLARYPAMQLQDIYKLLHQAALGPGHAVQNGDAARVQLANEVSALTPFAGEPLSEVISPDGKLARIHLRAYLGAGGDLDALADAFLRSAREVAASPDKLKKFCACLGDLAAAGGIPFSRVETAAYFEQIAQQHYPVVHHSSAFRDAYHPAYRVINVEYLKLPS